MAKFISLSLIATVSWSAFAWPTFGIYHKVFSDRFLIREIRARVEPPPPEAFASGSGRTPLSPFFTRELEAAVESAFASRAVREIELSDTTLERLSSAVVALALGPVERMRSKFVDLPATLTLSAVNSDVPPRSIPLAFRARNVDGSGRLGVLELYEVAGQRVRSQDQAANAILKALDAAADCATDVTPL